MTPESRDAIYVAAENGTVAAIDAATGVVRWTRTLNGRVLSLTALRGLGLIMQPEVLLADDLASGALVPVMQACLPAQRDVHLVYAPDRRQLPKLARFVEYVVGTLGVDGH